MAQVGEHIPAGENDWREHQFLSLLDRNNRHGIVLSWAIVGQPGRGHVNCRENAHVKAKLVAMGYENDRAAEIEMRASVEDGSFLQSNLMVFRRRRNREVPAEGEESGRGGERTEL